VRRFVDVLIGEGATQLLFVSHHAEDAPDCITHRLAFVPSGDGYTYQLGPWPEACTGVADPWFFQKNSANITSPCFKTKKKMSFENFSVNDSTNLACVTLFTSLICYLLTHDKPNGANHESSGYRW
jgi:hypothetical protein